jgi:hypothetical protein
MDRINGADTVDIGGGRRGFRDENLVAGVAGTEVTAAFLNGLQEEMMKVVTQAGLAPSDGDWTQLWQALQVLGLAADGRSRRWLSVLSMTLSSAPGSPSIGDAYLIPSGATGIWATNTGKIAEWTGSSWSYLTPPDGHGISLTDGRVFERVSGSYVEKLALDAQSGKWNYAVAGGTANELTATLSPAPSAYSEGMLFLVKVSLTSTLATSTINVNGLGAKTIVNPDGSALMPGALVASAKQLMGYDESLDKVILLTPANTGVRTGTNWIKHGDGTYEVWGIVSLTGTTTQLDITLPITFPTGIDTVLVTDVGASAYSGAGAPINTSKIRVYAQPYPINSGNGSIAAKNGLLTLQYRVWGK